MRALLLIVGLALLGAGLGLGFVPANATIAVPGSLTSQARGDTYSCGSPWLSDQQSMDREQQVVNLAAGVATVQGTLTVAENATALCLSAFGPRGVSGGVLAGLGALTLLGLGLVLAAGGRRQTPSGEGAAA